MARQLESQNGALVTTSSGQLGYQDNRLFGVRGLRFASDVRLNSQALLPLLSGPNDQETEAWENRLDYSIGRLRIRLAALVSRNTTQKRHVTPGGEEQTERGHRINRSILFTVARSFGTY